MPRVFDNTLKLLVVENIRKKIKQGKIAIDALSHANEATYS